MLEALIAFAPVAVVLCLTPGPATALVVRSAIRGGWPEAMRTTIGNSIGIALWATAAAVGVAAVVAASSTAFLLLKIVGAAYLVWLGVQSWRHARRTGSAEFVPRAGRSSGALRDGVVTSISNPKLAVFFVALFPTVIPDGVPVLPSALAMACLLVACDVLWFSVLAISVARARKAFVSGPWGRLAERVSGTVLIALGIRLATSQR